MTIEEVERTFTYQPPKGDQPQRYSAIRQAALSFALVIAQNTQPGRDQSVAIRKLRESVMFANAAIALEEQLRDRTS